MKEPEAKTAYQISHLADLTIDPWKTQILEEEWVRRKDAVGFAEARVKEATDKLKQYISDKVTIASRYLESVDVQARKQARIEVDTYKRILGFLEEAKP